MSITLSGSNGHARALPDNPDSNVSFPLEGAASGEQSWVDSSSSVERLLQDAMQRNRTSASRLRLRGPIKARLQSRVFRGESDAYPTPVAIKAFVDPATGRPAEREAVAYYQALQAVTKMAERSAAIAVARPYDLFERAGIVVMEWVDGPTLSRHVLTTTRADAASSLRKTGVWLAELHRSELHGTQPIDVDLMLGHLREQVTRLAPRRASYAGRVIEQLAATSERVAGHAVPWVRLHGDFKPDNLIVRDRSVIGIDLDLIFLNAATNDIAQFQNHLYLLTRSPIAFRQWGNAQCLFEAFDSGYRSRFQMAIPQLPLAWTRVGNALRLFMRQDRPRYKVTRWHADLQVRALLSDAMTVLARLT